MSVEVETKLRTLVAKQLIVDEDEVTLEADIEEDLGADSLDRVELVMVIEDGFDMEIADEDSEQWKTFGDVVWYVTARQQR
jgi:acyl carrier protein